jgi:hypothetical protein
MRKLMLLAVAAAGMASRSTAATIDQQNTASDSLVIILTNIGQSFTPTLTSIGYAEFDLIYTSDSTLQLELYAGLGYSGTLLGESASAAIGSTNPGVVDFDLLSTVALTPGNIYTLSLSDSTGSFGSLESTVNPYAGGDVFLDGSEESSFDTVFTEGTSDTSTPEASSFLLLALGGLGLSLHFRARLMERARVPRVA